MVASLSILVVDITLICEEPDTKEVAVESIEPDITIPLPNTTLFPPEDVILLPS